MPTAVLDLDVAALPATLAVAPRYGEALVLGRWRGVPVAVVRVPVREGRVPLAELRHELVAQGGWHIEQLRVREWLGLPLTPVPAPGTVAPLTVAVCTRDRPEDLERCLTALARLPDDGQEVLVVDSCSREDSTRQVVARHPGVRYVREARPGLDIARNRALREARGAIVAFTDDDAAADPGWLRALAARFRDPRVLCVTGLTLPLELETEAQEWFERTNGFGRGLRPRSFDGTAMDPFRVAQAGAGVNMALRREVLDLLGEFDEALDAGMPTQSGGDHEMFVRILAAGYRIEYEPAALVWHRHRRDWATLRSTIRGYGTGVYALLTRHFLRGELGAPRLALGWLRYQLAALWAALRGRPGAPPLHLVLEELRGCVAGPFAYFAARRRLARLPHVAAAKLVEPA